ncbi:hypothetical protein DSL72_001284 [Monilinia vaccinii-corymbosi]|uniref:YCII-related domain-containing protein n=1 Tax=Monilinia vaccinii-corymbosi TaxID=61207 RepID=A0A8A3PAK0_9HELO|nr:hypothetical protein DSL72_001284 [Monilinia vaccinii-corymbosi]
MSSAAAAAPATEKLEWLVVLPDNEGALERRVSVRPKHFEDLKTGVESGFWKMAGAFLSEPPTGDSPLKFQGSCMIALASSKEEVIEVLKKDIYADNDVWDFSKVKSPTFTTPHSQEILHTCCREPSESRDR